MMGNLILKSGDVYLILTHPTISVLCIMNIVKIFHLVCFGRLPQKDSVSFGLWMGWKCLYFSSEWPGTSSYISCGLSSFCHDAI